MTNSGSRLRSRLAHCVLRHLQLIQCCSDCRELCPVVCDPPRPSALMASQSIPKRRYLDNMTSERVDAGGVSNIAKLLQSLPPARHSGDDACTG